MVLLLLFVFVSTNVAVLVLRRDRTDTDHFRAPTILPVLAVISCIVLMTQQSASTWLRAGILIVVGLVLYLLARVTGSGGRRVNDDDIDDDIDDDDRSGRLT